MYWVCSDVSKILLQIYLSVLKIYTYMYLYLKILNYLKLWQAESKIAIMHMWENNLYSSFSYFCILNALSYIMSFDSGVINNNGNSAIISTWYI